LVTTHKEQPHIGLLRTLGGATWGNAGYVWIGRSTSTNTPGICGIAMMPSYPTV